MDMFKLEALIVYICIYTWISRIRHEQYDLLFRKPRFKFWQQFKDTRHYIGLYYREFIHTKHIIFDGQHLKTLSNIFCSLILIAWLCEKMKVNLKVKGLSNFFENDVIINNPSEYREDYLKVKKVFLAGGAKMLWIAVMCTRSEYGYKILQKMQIKKELAECADGWFANHIAGDWVAVHFRGTDFADMKTQYKNRYRLKLDDYITYLQSVLDKQRSILVCSDQAQFVEKMHIAFPGRVFARDIQRSYDYRMLHIDPEYRGAQQKKDALTDLLVLAKADLVYTTGSGFIDTLRFLNPSIKIISLDGRWLVKSFSIGRGSPNGAPIPEEDIFKHLVKHYRN